jgi:hypothetical protein
MWCRHSIRDIPDYPVNVVLTHINFVLTQSANANPNWGEVRANVRCLKTGPF